MSIPILVERHPTPNQQAGGSNWHRITTHTGWSGPPFALKSEWRCVRVRAYTIPKGDGLLYLQDIAKNHQCRGYGSEIRTMQSRIPSYFAISPRMRPPPPLSESPFGESLEGSTCPSFVLQDTDGNEVCRQRRGDQAVSRTYVASETIHLRELWKQGGKPKKVPWRS